jgi:hypothetical protein
MYTDMKDGSAIKPDMHVIPHGATMAPISAELERLTHRRELAIRAIGAVAEVLEVDVTVPMLQRIAEAEDEDPTVHITAVRALRCIEGISKEDSVVIKTIGEVGIYDYVEGVIEYGADQNLYLKLMDTHGLSAREVTGLYSLRELIAEHSAGAKHGFDYLFTVLETAGISIPEAANDPYDALAQLDERGFFVDHIGGLSFDTPRLMPSQADGSPRLLPDDYDGTVSAAILEHQRDVFGRPKEEQED